MCVSNKTGEPIIELGEVTQELFVVVSGEVDRKSQSSDTELLKTGSHFGEVSLLYDQVLTSIFTPAKFMMS
jgi:CRP-like cAMP-binding protein